VASHFTIWLRRYWSHGVLIPIAILAANVTLLAPAIARATCDSANAADHLDLARIEQQGHQWSSARRDAEAAVSGFLQCAREQRGSQYANSLYEAGSAHIIIGLAIVGTGGSQNNREFSRAYALFRAVASSAQSNAIQKKLGTQKAKSLRSALPLLSNSASLADIPSPRAVPTSIASTPLPLVRQISPPSAIVAVAEPTSQPTALPLLQATVVDAWQTIYPGQGSAFQHLRVRLLANSDTVVSAKAFRITVLVNGVNETVYGYAGAAPSYSRVNFLAGNNAPATVAVSSVDPADDLGRGAIAMHRGDEVTKVVTFIVRTGSQFNKGDPSALTVFPEK
jgi:hypothetical protein